MKYFQSFKHLALVAAAALLSLGAISAQAGVQAGNYQTHTLPSTTRHVVQAPAVESAVDTDNTVASTPVTAGNYQTHTLPATTRRVVTRQRVETDGRDVAMSGQR